MWVYKYEVKWLKSQFIADLRKLEIGGPKCEIADVQELILGVGLLP